MTARIARMVAVAARPLRLMFGCWLMGRLRLCGPLDWPGCVCVCRCGPGLRGVWWVSMATIALQEEEGSHLLATDRAASSSYK